MKDAKQYAEENPLFMRSLAKALQVLEAFDTPEQFNGLTEIATATGLDKSTVQRAVYTLHQLGYLERDPASRRYALDKRVLGLTFAYLRSHPIVARATPTLIDLRRTVQERVGLSLWDDLDLIYAVRLQSKRETFFATLIGRRMPIYCTSAGRVILACLPTDEARELLQRSERVQRTAQTLTDVDDILEKVAETREAGYALNVEEALPGELSLSAVVRSGEQGRPVGSISVSASVAEWDPAEFERQIAPLVMEAAHAVNG